MSNNLFTLFSGFDDDGANIDNHWTGKMFNLGVSGSKKSNRFVIRGLIQATQSININFSFDSAPFVTFFTVQGNASYVLQGRFAKRLLCNSLPGTLLAVFIPPQPQWLRQSARLEFGFCTSQSKCQFG